MHVLCQLRALVGAIPRGSVRRESRRFLATTTRCRETQQDALRRLLALNSESRFGRAHRFGEIRTTADFRKRLRVADYEAYRPYIEQLKLGDHEAMLGPGNRLLMFSLSSGTTSQSKFIPITQQFLDDYRRGWQIWGIQTLDDHPGVNCRNIVQLSSDYDRFRTPGGTPCGNISGLVTAIQKPIVRTMYTVPGIVSKISDSDAKNYTALRLAVADDNVGMVITANPSTLIQLAKIADAESESLIRDIADGTLSLRYPVAEDVRKKLRRRISRPNRARARRLEQIIAETGRLFPRDYWPGMQVVAVWTGGSAGAYLSSLRRFYGDVAMRDHGLSASEGRMTIPLHDNRSDGVLDVVTHFFEFIPEREHGCENPTVLEAHELQEGESYFILLTTSSGLYRYDIHDVVQCTGFCGTTPMLKFLHKGAHIANVTGEKVSESQVVTAVCNSVEQMQIHLKHFTVSPVWGEPPRYQLLAEEQDVLSPSVGEELADHVDRQLQQLNCEYREKRQSGRLASLKWLPLPEGTWMRFAKKSQQKLGGSQEQYKHPCLVPDMDFSARLVREFVMDQEAVA
jgi:hypothetical protein